MDKLKRVRDLISRATHTSTPEEEARSSAMIALKLLVSEGFKVVDPRAQGSARPADDADGFADMVDAIKRSAEAARRKQREAEETRRKTANAQQADHQRRADEHARRVADVKAENEKRRQAQPNVSVECRRCLKTFVYESWMKLTSHKSCPHCHASWPFSANILHDSFGVRPPGPAYDPTKVHTAPQNQRGYTYHETPPGRPTPRAWFTCHVVRCGEVYGWPYVPGTPRPVTACPVCRDTLYQREATPTEAASGQRDAPAEVPPDPPRQGKESHDRGGTYTRNRDGSASWRRNPTYDYSTAEVFVGGVKVGNVSGGVDFTDDPPPRPKTEVHQGSFRMSPNDFEDMFGNFFGRDGKKPR